MVEAVEGRFSRSAQPGKDEGCGCAHVSAGDGGTVQSLEAGSVGLEESIELYKRALRLHAACETRLRAAELQITELGRRGVAGSEPEG